MTMHANTDSYERDERDSEALSAALAAEMGQAPWYLWSVAAHTVLFLALLLIPVPVRMQEGIPPSTFGIEDPMPPEPVEDPIETDDQPLNPTFDPVEKIIEDTVEVKVPEDIEIVADMPVMEEDEIEQVAEGMPDSFSEIQTADMNMEAVMGVGASGAKGGHNRLGRPDGGDKVTKGRIVRTIGGGKPNTYIDTVTLSLNWLAEHQEADGHWDCARFGGAGHDTAVTALATLAFLADGHSPDARTRYRTHIRKAIEWLIKQQDASGRVGPHRYEAAFGTMALAEAYGMCRKGSSWYHQLRGPAQKAVDYAVETQCAAGGWDYAPTSQRNDTSVSGWWVMGLKSAVIADLHVPSETIEKARTYLANATNDSGSCSYAGNYAAPAAVQAGGGSIRMSAVSLTCRLFLGGARDCPEIVATDRRVANNRLTPDSFDFYMWYYQGLGLFQMGAKRPAWKQFLAGLEQSVARTQIKEGSVKQLRGSWNPDTDHFGAKWGRVGQTALGSLMLTLWRYQKVEKAI